MDIIGTYKTISEKAVGEYREKGSKFFAYAYPVTNRDIIKQHMDALRSEHFKARHHCFAFRMGLDKNDFRASDDGEPSGTAGKPILGQIDSFGLTDVLIIVVRYFGGTKLGVPGLINAYRTAAKDALQQAKIIEVIIKKRYKITFPYDLMNDVMRLTKEKDVSIIEQIFEGEQAIMIVEFPIVTAESIIDKFEEGLRINQTIEKVKIELVP